MADSRCPSCDRLRRLRGNYRCDTHLRRAVAASDDLSGGVDYRSVIETVKKFALGYEGKTLERFAEQLADQLMEGFPIQRLHLAVDKPRYTRRLGLREIRVEVER